MYAHAIPDLLVICFHKLPCSSCTTLIGSCCWPFGVFNLERDMDNIEREGEREEGGGEGEACCVDLLEQLLFKRG